MDLNKSNLMSDIQALLQNIQGLGSVAGHNDPMLEGKHFAAQIQRNLHNLVEDLHRNIPNTLQIALFGSTENFVNFKETCLEGREVVNLGRVGAGANAEIAQMLRKLPDGQVLSPREQYLLATSAEESSQLLKSGSSFSKWLEKLAACQDEEGSLAGQMKRLSHLASELHVRIDGSKVFEAAQSRLGSVMLGVAALPLPCFLEFLKNITNFENFLYTQVSEFAALPIPAEKAMPLGSASSLLIKLSEDVPASSTSK